MDECTFFKDEMGFKTSGDTSMWFEMSAEYSLFVEYKIEAPVHNEWYISGLKYKG